MLRTKMMTNTVSLIFNGFFLSVLFYITFYFVLLFFLFPEKANDRCEPFHKLLFMKSVNLFFLVELKSDPIKGVSSTKATDFFCNC